ncbi:NADH-quinone oxidoreductase subunit C [uncultured Ferrovibrio sp.]|jgi:NADH-quinone oxidoreductase subunit C|uniref:NADH-quinone oxidoreductase subunit C n=1 Tax=uncultured Ferrovibrio sp. TaxID=1576913 RepID=UPI00261FE966|nr:NADH-quinone oxidoreductase subunit C [uncultured Ferrovibrio sp.]
MTETTAPDRKTLVHKQEQALRELGEHIAASLGADVLEWSVAKAELTIRVPAERITKVLTFLRDDGNCQFAQLMDICGVDWPERPKRFDVVYHLLSLKLNQRIRVKVETDEETPVPSVTGVFSSAGWFERETWDMYGVMFSGHPDLRRILSDYGFEGHAQRKDFPLSGYVEVRYDNEQKRVVYEPVQLTQEFRRFDFMSPWEGAQYVLPGDEKAGEGAKS